MNKIISFLSLLIVVAFSSCSGSDPETEKKLEGTWESVEYENEDGMKMKITSLETYSLSDHVYHSTVKMEMLSPVYVNMGTVSYSGSWSASKDMVTCKIDKNSVSFNFSNMLDSDEKRELKQDFLSSLKEQNYEEGMHITSSITDSFTASDDEGESFTYTRVK